MDDIVKVAGYFNLEFGNEPGGEAGGVPGGMNLFNLNLPMWARRSLQVAYVALTVITTIIPIGKLVLAAKVFLQGALKLGLKATAKKLLTAVAARIPTRAAISGALTRARGAVSSALSRIGGLFGRTRGIARDALSANGLIRFGKMSGGAQRIVQQFQTKGRVFIGSGARVDELRQASMFLGREIGVATDRNGRLVAILGSVNRTKFGFTDTPLFHTHPVFNSLPEHFTLDIRSATNLVEAVVDWGGTITHYNKTGILNTVLSSPINALGYVVGYR